MLALHLEDLERNSRPVNPTLGPSLQSSYLILKTLPWAAGGGGGEKFSYLYSSSISNICAKQR